MAHLVPSHIGVNDSFDTLKVGVGPFDELEGVCEKWDNIARNSFELISWIKTSFFN